MEGANWRNWLQPSVAFAIVASAEVGNFMKTQLLAVKGRSSRRQERGGKGRGKMHIPENTTVSSSDIPDNTFCHGAISIAPLGVRGRRHNSESKR